jgi:hypothetical protein
LGEVRRGWEKLEANAPPHHNEKKINQQEKQINNKKYSMFAANGYIKMSIRAS